ncbi:MAG: NEW3 domain-containing protein [Candidatus Nanohalobium sp.]
MLRKLFSLTVLAVLFASFTAGVTGQDVVLKEGEIEEIGNYSFHYLSPGDDVVFKIGKITEEGEKIVQIFENSELWNLSSEKRELEGLSYSIENISLSDEEIRLKVFSNKQIFASSEIKTDDIPQRILVAQGGSTSFTLEISNTGIIDQTFQLNIESAAEASATFKNQGFNVSRIHVPAGETKQVQASIKFSKNSSTGLNNLTVIAEGTSISEKNFKFYVRPQEFEELERELNTDLETRYKRVSPGSEFSFTYSVRNLGEGVVNDVELDVTVPEGWEKSVTPESIERIRRYEPGTFRVDITVPENVKQGDYFVEVKSSTGQVSKVGSSRLRVNVSKKSGLRYLGLAIMVLSLASLAAAYRKFGRR